MFTSGGQTLSKDCKLCKKCKLQSLFNYVSHNSVAKNKTQYIFLYILVLCPLKFREFQCSKIIGLKHVFELKLQWPAQGHDLNPIKHLRDELKHRLRGRPFISAQPR